MFTPRASASTSNGCAYSRSIRSRTRLSSVRSRRCWASSGRLVTHGSYVAPQPPGGQSLSGGDALSSTHEEKYTNLSVSSEISSAGTSVNSPDRRKARLSALLNALNTADAPEYDSDSINV